MNAKKNRVRRPQMATAPGVSSGFIINNMLKFAIYNHVLRGGNLYEI
jgi:hypothetical protein